MSSYPSSPLLQAPLVVSATESREEGNYTLRVNATDSDNNRVIDAKNVRVDFD